MNPLNFMTINLFIPFQVKPTLIKNAVDQIFGVESVIKYVDNPSMPQIIFHYSEKEERYLDIELESKEFDPNLTCVKIALNNWGHGELIINELANYFSGWIVIGKEKTYIDRVPQGIVLSKSNVLYQLMAKDPELTEYSLSFGAMLKWIYKNRNAIEHLKFCDA